MQVDRIESIRNKPISSELFGTRAETRSASWKRIVTRKGLYVITISPGVGEGVGLNRVKSVTGKSFSK